jgi:hypothetical protein
VHNPATSNILDQSTNNLKFESFYNNHIRKLLLVRNGDRYLAKGNYNITRLEYILKLFPDVRFVIPQWNYVAIPEKARVSYVIKS